MPLDVGDAAGVIVRRLRATPERYPKYGYDIWLPSVWEDYVRERDGLPMSEYHEVAVRGMGLSSVFYAAAWEFCRRGILRSGVKAVREQVVDGSDGYSFTPMGRQWLARVDDLQFVPIEQGRVAQMLSRFDDRFGSGYASGPKRPCGAISQSPILGAVQ